MSSFSKNNFEVQEYSFQSFQQAPENAHEVRDFEFKPLVTGQQLVRDPEFQKVIKIERTHAKESQFKVNPIVEKHRGFKDQEDHEYEMRVRDEVEKRVQKIQEEAFRAGFEQGVEEGREEVYNQTRHEVEEKLQDFTAMISDVLQTHENILHNQKKDIYRLIKNLTKWITLKELDNDGKYLERLMEKLLLEIQTRSNLLIQVNMNDFQKMPEVLEVVQARLGEIKNVRIEIDPAIETRGLIVESDNGIINATLEEQFKGLDKLFEQVLVESQEN